MRDDTVRVRRPRCFGPDLVVHAFSAADAFGAELLLRLNHGDTGERFVTLLTLGRHSFALVTSERLLMLAQRNTVNDFSVSTEVWFSGLYGYRVVRDNAILYLELTVSEQV